MRIALDAMGGDQAPNEIVAGALQALEDLGDEELILIGDEPRILRLLGKPDVWEKNISIVHAPEVIEMHDHPVESLRRKRKSSIAIMAKMAADDKADVAISAGNTGACVAGCQMQMRLLPGVNRPGILVVIPTINGPIAICDVGANVSPKPINLHQYALMGSLYMKEIFNIDDPTIGLISVGQEDNKGNELIKKVNQMIREDEHLNFAGNVEAREFLNRPCDVIVCDGFVGNVILKFAEGLAEGLFRIISQELTKQKPELAQQFKPIMDNVYKEHDHIEYGGAPLLGVAGTCIICHGASDARAIKNAVLRSRELVNTRINGKITEWLASVPVSEVES